jgi:hypothetical protein
MNTKVGQPFEAWVEARVVLRHEALKQENVIEMDPQVAAAFRASQAVSSKCAAPPPLPNPSLLY